MISQATSLGNIGLCLQHQRDFEGALTYHHRALAIDTEQGNYGGQLRHLQNIAFCYSMIGRDDHMLSTLARAYKLLERQGNIEDRAEALLNMALIVAGGDLNIALSYVVHAMMLSADKE